MATFNISGPDINVEDIMQNIKNNIARKKEAGIYPESLEINLNMPLPETSEIPLFRRPFIGPIKVLIKKLILRIIGKPVNGIIR